MKLCLSFGIDLISCPRVADNVMRLDRFILLVFVFGILTVCVRHYSLPVRRPGE